MPDLMIVRDGILPLAFPKDDLLTRSLRRSKTVSGKNPSHKHVAPSARVVQSEAALDQKERGRWFRPLRQEAVFATMSVPLPHGRGPKKRPLVETLRKAFGRSRRADSCGRVRAITIR